MQKIFEKDRKEHKRMEKIKILQPYRRDVVKQVNVYRLPYGDLNILYEDKTPDLPIKIVEHDVTHQIYYYKEVPGYDGVYGVTFDGTVLSFKSRNINTAEDNNYQLKVRVKKPALVGTKREYYAVPLCKDGINTQYNIHRLVLECWVGLPTGFNPDGTPMRTPPECNHKDINPKNNFYQNLEWCDRFYNNAHRIASEGWNYKYKTLETGRKRSEHSIEYYQKRKQKLFDEIERLSQENDDIANGVYIDDKEHSLKYYRNKIATNKVLIDFNLEEITSIDEILNTKESA